MAAPKKTFICSACGHELPKWAGQCPACKEWNTIEEAEPESPAVSARGNAVRVLPGKAQRLSEISGRDDPRYSSGIGELDRVLGGGIVKGSLTLVAGEPGIGKSTLLLQICSTVSENCRTLYVSGEESARQLKLRAERLHVNPPELYFLAETDIDVIKATVLDGRYDLVIVDSIQTISRRTAAAAPGSVSQVRDCTLELMNLAKSMGVPVMVVGHVNKEGAIAGPKVLEHMVDCVLYFEGERNGPYRILRAEKNRFGSTNEIGVFEMGELGLTEIPNPSQSLLAGRPKGVPGSSITCVMEGSRPILAEVQALVAPTVFGFPRRTSAGIDTNRAVILLSVLEKRGGVPLANSDAYINVIGGLKIEETAVNLAVILAVVSAFRDIPLPDDVIAFGEVGLTGEVRSVSSCEQRLAEAARMGICHAIVPFANKDKLRIPPEMQVTFVRNIHQAIGVALSVKEENVHEK
ncbi:MAG: DNA repair protein RadA [Clostridia bacterium]|nr:DNA repair protein RadA [Clostridia bacterium]